MDVIGKIQIRESFTKKQLERIESELRANGCLQKAALYADIHYSTFKKAIEKGTAVKKEQIKKIMEFCDLVKQQKAA